jgi:hypothetical protein
VSTQLLLNDGDINNNVHSQRLKPTTESAPSVRYRGSPRLISETLQVRRTSRERNFGNENSENFFLSDSSVYFLYRLALHNDVSVNDGPHARWWSDKIIITQCVRKVDVRLAYDT